MAAPGRYSIFRAGFAASFIVSLLVAVWWMSQAIPYFGYGPRDLTGFEGWWNLALGVGIPVFIIGLLHSLPPWLLLLLLAAVQRFTRLKLWERPTTEDRYFPQIGVAYVYACALTMVVWSIFQTPDIFRIALDIFVTFSPGLLVVAWWLLRRATGGVKAVKA